MQSVPMPSAADLVLGIALPACLAGIPLFVGPRLVDRAAGGLAGIGFGLGWLVAYVGLVGFPAWPGAGTTLPARDWLAWIVIAATLLALLAERIPSWLLRVLLTGFLVGLSLHAWVAAAITFALVVAAWTSVEAFSARAPGSSTPLVLLAIAVGTSFASLTHSAMIAQLAGAIAACLGASVVVAWTDRRFRLPRAAITVIVLVLAGCLLNGAFYAGVPRSSALLLFAALLAPWLAEVPALGGASTWKRALFAAVPAGIAVALAWSPMSEG